MEIQNVQEYLSAHGIKKTSFRIELLGLFIKSKHSLSHQDIKAKVISTQDKVTIYRTLNTFLKKGLIHKVPDANNVSKYALCQKECYKETHQHNHAHFICKACKNTFCMNEIKAPEIEDARGFRIESAKLTLEGYCPDCTSSAD